MVAKMKGWRQHAGVGLALLLVLWGVWRCWAFTLDDGFVFLRYAQNLSDGHGLVFNPGERVEGHSNTLWVLWLWLGGSIGAPLLGWAKLSGVAALLALVGCVWWLAHRLTSVLVPEGGRGAVLTAALLSTSAIALHPGAAYYATSAMGTTLVMLLLTLAAGASALDLLSADAPKSKGPAKSKTKEKTKQTKQIKLKGAAKSKNKAPTATEETRTTPYARIHLIATAALCLTRPEAPLLWLALCARWWHHRRNAIARRRELLCAGFALLPFIALSLWRYAYYDSWLPNTYAAKPSTLLSHPSGAFRYLADSGTALGWGLLLVLLAALLKVARDSLTDLRQRLLVTTLLWPVLAQLGFTLYSGGDWMPHGRFMLVALPLLWLIAAVALVRVADWKLMTTVAAMAVTLQGWGARTFWQELDANSAHDHALRSDGNVAMARWMKQHLPVGSTVVTDEIGALGFHSELHIMDMWGLVDREIATLLSARGFNPYNSSIGTRTRRDSLDAIAIKLLKRQPDYIVIDYRAPAPPPATPYDRRAFMPYTMSGMAVNMPDDYRLVQAFPLMTNPPKTFLLLGRKQDSQP